MDGFPRPKMNFAGSIRLRFARTSATSILLLTICTLVAATPWPASAAVRIHVRGAARLAARASRGSTGDLVVLGTLVDDAGTPIGHAPIDATLSASGDSAAPLHAFRPCQSSAPPPTAPGGLSPLRTDDAGELCLEATLPSAAYVAHLSFAGTALVDGATLDLPVDLQRMPLALRFDPAPRVVHLDGPVLLRASAFVASDMAAPATGLHVEVTDERGKSLATSVSDALGRAHFTVMPSAFAPPGPGKLRLSCSGEECATGSGVEIDVERHARVRLDPEDSELRVRAQSPEDGTPLDVKVTTSLDAPVEEGTVEARLSGVIIGAATVDHGVAHLVVTFRPSTNGDAAIGLHYLPASPWLEPGDDAVAHVEVRAKTALRQSPLLAAGIVVVAWLLGTRLRGRIKPRVPPPATAKPSAPVPPRDVAGIEVVASDAAGTTWSGRVVDAHDRATIAGAEVIVERGGFTNAELVAHAVTDDDGTFLLPSFVSRPGDHLLVQGRLHAELRQPLPQAGQLSIQLVSRRRALLDRLIAWARARLRDNARVEPTPAQVKRRAHDFEVKRWAEATERAVFGPDEVDAVAEREVDHLAPKPRERASDAPPA